MDAILADNFAKASSFNKVKHIVFMSGLIPNTNELSPHLRSRLECERILGAYGVPVTTLRAGLIIGAKGSSYPILKKLVERLSCILLPKWFGKIKKNKSPNNALVVLTIISIIIGGLFLLGL